VRKLKADLRRAVQLLPQFDKIFLQGCRIVTENHAYSSSTSGYAT